MTPLCAIYKTVGKRAYIQVACLILCYLLLTGAYSEIGPIYDHKMANNVGQLENVTLTAHVLVALATVDTLTGVAQTQVETAKTKAAEFLDSRVQFLVDTDPHQTALVTYALTLASSNNQNAAFERLINMSTNGEYWSQRPVPRNPQITVQTVPYIGPRELYPHEGAAVAATSYALLVYTEADRITDAIPIMKWLQTMRNTIGGFAGTRVSDVHCSSVLVSGQRDVQVKYVVWMC